MSHSPSVRFPAGSDVAIVGAGVIGLAIGWRLAQAGKRVAVFDRGQSGRGASWAAAGMLAAGAELEPGEQALWHLNRASQRRWPGFAVALRAASGIDPGYRDEGTMIVALTRDDAERLRATVEFQRRHEVAIDWLSAADARRREPCLTPALAGAALSPEDHQVDNRCVAEALKAAVLGTGGAVYENAPVDAIDIEGGRARGVIVQGERHRAATVVLAAGAWSSAIAGLPPALRPPIRPIKGQMLALQMDPAEPLLRHVLWTQGAYLVPRNDGRLIVGATVEERGFDATLTAGGLYALLDGAWRALPGVEELAIHETWVGFRPGSRDDAPILGPSGVDGLVLATGHHRNGILLIPITADAIATLILDGTIDDAIRPFGMERFTATAKERALAS